MESIKKIKSHKKVLFYIWITLLCITIAIIVYALPQTNPPNNIAAQPQPRAPSPTASPPTPTQTPTSTPENVAKAFYNWYMAYPKDPLTTGAYKTSPLLSADFIALTTEFLQGHTGTEPYDPIFCIINKNKNVYVGDAHYINNDTANVVIYRNNDNKDIYRVSLVRSNDTWLIKDIVCRH